MINLIILRFITELCGQEDSNFHRENPDCPLKAARLPFRHDRNCLFLFLFYNRNKSKSISFKTKRLKSYNFKRFLIYLFFFSPKLKTNPITAMTNISKKALCPPSTINCSFDKWLAESVIFC